MWKNCLECATAFTVTSRVFLLLRILPPTSAAAQAMKLHKDAQATFANIKEEAEDICFDAKQQAAEACDCEQ